MHTITFDLSLSLLLLLLVTNRDNMRGYQAHATVRANSVRRDTSHGVYYVEIVSCACVYHVMRSEEAICYEMCGTRRRFSVARRLVVIEVLLSDRQAFFGCNYVLIVEATRVLFGGKNR